MSAFVIPSSPVQADSDGELKTLQMFYNEDDLVVTPARSPKPVSQVPENVTIITSEDIKRINAHTVAEALFNVTGVQMDISGGPGSVSNTSIQGSKSRHVLVMIDGVRLNILSEVTADVGVIPVQNIERIEIIKGPASSSWGSSLGGVVNIITKVPDDSKKIGGTLSATFGSRSTGDYRSEVTGSTGKIGYYLSGGGLVSDGLLPHNSFHGGNVYGKLTLAATEKADLSFSFAYNANSRGLAEAGPFFFDSDFSTGFATLSFSYAFNDELSMDMSLQGSKKTAKVAVSQSGTGSLLAESATKDRNIGGSATVNWTRKTNQMTAGVEFDLGDLRSPGIANMKQDLDRWAIFVNDTFKIGRLSVIPGFRYDYTTTNGDFLSPSIGATFPLTSNTLLRAFVARGFSIPPLGYTFGQSAFYTPNPNLKMERVWSYSAGFESAELRYVWLKTMFFRHDISDVIDSQSIGPRLFTMVNVDKQRREGVEVELKTMPVYDTSLVAGYALINANNRSTGAEISGTPRYTVDVGLQYDDRKTLQGNLKGHYIRWRQSPSDNGSFNAMVWDLNLVKKLPRLLGGTADVFFTAHNLFNSAQYAFVPYRNPGRWFEGGVRLSF